MGILAVLENQALTLTMLAAKSRLSAITVQKNIEFHLIKNDLIIIGEGRRRFITRKGKQILQQVEEWNQNT